MCTKAMSSAKKGESKNALSLLISVFGFGFFHRAKPVSQQAQSACWRQHCGHMLDEKSRRGSKAPRARQKTRTNNQKEKKNEDSIMATKTTTKKPATTTAAVKTTAAKPTAAPEPAAVATAAPAPAPAPAPKKAPAKKAAPKQEPASPATKVVFEYGDKQVVAKELLAKAMESFRAAHADIEIQEMQLYIKADDNCAYIVVNGTEYPEDKVNF